VVGLGLWFVCCSGELGVGSMGGCLLDVDW